MSGHMTNVNTVEYQKNCIVGFPNREEMKELTQKNMVGGNLGDNANLQNRDWGDRT